MRASLFYIIIFLSAFLSCTKKEEMHLPVFADLTAVYPCSSVQISGQEAEIELPVVILTDNENNGIITAITGLTPLFTTLSTACSLICF